ncbi:MAG: hypothetical protein M1381_08030 [Deltaproteobacteria bacterium]|nr:hypothetical protein [Deltaproteobacteria bacterium]MCL5791427.1 hypothetical protein [Deltaproteobacteria bacterium]
MGIVHKSIIHKLIVFSIYIIISVIITYPAILNIRTAYIGNGSDPELFMWFIKWVQYAIGHFHDPLISRHILFPDGVNLMWNSSIILPALILSPLTKFFGAIFSYNIIVIGALCLSAFTAYIATLRFVNSHSASFFSGLIYGFSPYMIAQSMGHPHVTLAFIPPLLVWLGYDILVSSKIEMWKSGTILGVLLFCQLLFGEEMLASEIIISTVAVAVIFILNRQDLKQHIVYVLRVFLIGIPLFLVLSLPFLYMQFAGPARPIGLLQPQNVFVTDLLNFIIPGPFQLLKTGITLNIVSKFTGNASEWDGYIGIPFLLIIFYTIIRWYKEKNVKFLAYMILVSALLSLGPYLHINGHITKIPLPWILFESLPLLEHLLPGRFALYVILFSGITIAIFISKVNKQEKIPKFTAYAVFTIGLFCIIPVFLVSPYPVQKPSIPVIFKNSTIQHYIPENSNILVVPVSEGAEGTAMLWQIYSDMWFKMPEGFAINRYGFGPMPSLFIKTVDSIQKNGVSPQMDHGSKAEIYGYLKYYDIRYIIVGPTKNKQNIVSFFTAILGKGYTLTHGVYIWTVDPSALKQGYFISGDKYSTYYKNMDWIGRQIEITTYNTIVTIEISGKWRHNGIPMNITVYIKRRSSGDKISEYLYRVTNNTNITLFAPPNATMTIIADNTWIPDRYIHNGDHRELSVLFEVKSIQDKNRK